MEITNKNAHSYYVNTTNSMAKSAANRMARDGINQAPCINGITMDDVMTAYNEAFEAKTLMPYKFFLAAKKLTNSGKANRLQRKLQTNKRSNW